MPADCYAKDTILIANRKTRATMFNPPAGAAIHIPIVVEYTPAPKIPLLQPVCPRGWAASMLIGICKGVSAERFMIGKGLDVFDVSSKGLLCSGKPEDPDHR
jgi:hypothetical protein